MIAKVGRMPEMPVLEEDSLIRGYTRTLIRVRMIPRTTHAP
jgi:hypothetical protein